MKAAPIQEIFKHIRRIQIKATRNVNTFFAGAYRSAFKGVGLEFEEAREYFPGDNVDHIDWHLTARMQKPYVKIFREERQLSVMLVVDVSASSHFGSGDRLKSEIIAEIAAVLAFSALKNHDKVGLILFSEHIELYLKPRSDLRHVLRVIRELLFFTPKKKGTNIKGALSFLGKVQKKHSICFFISDFLGKPFDHDANLISKRHELVLIDVSDKQEERFPNLGLTEVRDLESGEILALDTANRQNQEQFFLEATNQKKALHDLAKRIGAEMISIKSDGSHLDKLYQFFKLRKYKK